MWWLVIILDYNQVCLANLFKQVSNTENIEEGLVRHMVLNSIRSIVKKFPSHGNVVIACDGPSYWRREYFPQYKQHRKADREKSGHDWTTIFSILHKIREELAENMPYCVIRLPGAEADDIIATLTKRYSPHENVIIVSSDKDFVQLHTNKSVRQWSPIQNKFVTSHDPLQEKIEHILSGDRGDGVPNVLSPDNTFVDGIRQKVISKKKLNEWMHRPVEYQSLPGYKRNQMMIDFDYIPSAITDGIIQQYEAYESKPMIRQKMLNYFIQNRLKNLIESIHDF